MKLAVGLLLSLGVASCTPAPESQQDASGKGASAPSQPAVTVTRLPDNPIIRPDMDARMGSNVQGPSMIRVPDWVEQPLGRYYLYFADHKGDYIRLAYSDSPEGPFTIYGPGSLQLAQSHFRIEPAEIPEEVAQEIQATADLGGFAEGPVEGVPAPLDSATKPHIASPDVHVRHDRREIVMYFHGLEGFRQQFSRMATSSDGIHFEALEEPIGRSYLRAFEHDGQWYAMGMPGVFYRSADGFPPFEEGPTLFENTMRHAGLVKRGDLLYVFWTRVGDNPEHILLSTIDLSHQGKNDDWQSWQASDPVSVLKPEEPWEGVDRPLEPSVRDAINVRVNQLRDPAVFEDAGRGYLLYAVAGESGIAIAELAFR